MLNNETTILQILNFCMTWIANYSWTFAPDKRHMRCIFHRLNICFGFRFLAYAIQSMKTGDALESKNGFSFFKRAQKKTS